MARKNLILLKVFKVYYNNKKNNYDNFLILYFLNKYLIKKLIHL